MNTVAIGLTDPRYNSDPPYHPAHPFPETRFSELSASPNPAYTLFRQLMRDLQLDVSNYDTKLWNPFGHYIKPGQTVLIKPNFVSHRNLSGGDLYAVVTHPSILRVAVDYAFIALRGSGRIVIADSPEMYCCWNELMNQLRLDSIQDFYWRMFRFPIDVIDLRNFEVISADSPLVNGNRKVLPGDPAGSISVNLGAESHFAGLTKTNYYGADYDREATRRVHQGLRHEYTISRSVLSADVVISVPKMKTHKKVGITLNLKGLVGTVTDKNCLIHYRVGTPADGGDQLPASQPTLDRTVLRMQRWLSDRTLARKDRWGDRLYKVASTLYRNSVGPFIRLDKSTLVQDGGNWHGNDSAWRMVADLAKIFYFVDRNGKICSQPQRKMFCIVDGIIGGEGNGPLHPDAKSSGWLLLGENPLSVDLTAATIMGMDYHKLRQFDIVTDSRWDFDRPEEVTVIYQHILTETLSLFRRNSDQWRPHYRPAEGWIGKIELDPTRLQTTAQTDFIKSA